MSEGWSIKIRGKEVQNPLARFGLALFAVVLLAAAVILLGAVLFALPWILLAVGGIIVITFPVDIILKSMGRNGFYKRDGNSFSYSINADSFRRRA